MIHEVLIMFNIKKYIWATRVGKVRKIAQAEND